MNDEEEEQRLRSVAIQNAESVFVARQRAEEELLRTKEALELKTQELANSLALMRATLESTTDGILATDRSGGVTSFNERFLQMWRLPRGIMDSKDHRQIANAIGENLRDPVQFLDRIDEIYASAPPESYDLLDLADGRVFERFSRIQFVENQNVGRVWSLRDISDRKQAETSLRDSESRYRAIGEAIDYGVWMCDADGRNTYASDSFLQLVGISQEQCSDFGWSDALHPEDAEKTISAWQTCVRTGGIWDREHRFRGVDGEWHFVLARGVPIRSGTGQVIGWAGINLDISRLKRAEQSLREADHRKDEFLAMLAHELRNPLAPIRNAVQVLRLRGDTEQTVQSVSEMMERQISQLVRLVDDLLDISRVSRGRIELRRARIELASVVSHAAEACHSHYSSMEHQLTVSLPPHPIYLNADLTRLTQVVGNLLNNACKFTDKGGQIEIAVNVESPATHEESFENEVSRGDPSDTSPNAVRTPFAVIRVRDNGIGIAADQLPRIFDMFVQVDTSLERSVSGLGIGLTLVKNLVEMHDGTISVQSAGVGHGTEFAVRLPMADCPLPIEEPRDDADRQSKIKNQKSRRILVVDDNRDAAMSLAMLLNLAGNETQTRFDGRAAVEAAATFQPDVVLLDIGLPKLNGYEAARMIRELPHGKSIVLVALTGWGQEEDRRKSREAGFDGHMVKPVDLEALKTLLIELLPTKDAS